MQHVYSRMTFIHAYIYLPNLLTNWKILIIPETRGLSYNIIDIKLPFRIRTRGYKKSMQIPTSPVPKQSLLRLCCIDSPGKLLVAPLLTIEVNAVKFYAERW